MKILYFYPEHRGDFMFQWQRIHFIDELSRSGTNIEILNPLDYDSLEQAHEELLKILKNNEYDLFFMSASLYVSKDVLASIKELGIPTLCFRPDNLLIPYIDKDIASSFDLVWLTTMETEDLYKKWGANYFFAPYAANPHTFVPQDGNLIKKVGFIGTPYGSRSNMINSLVKAGINIDVYCRNNPSLKSEKFIPKYQGPIMSSWEVLLNNISYKEGRTVLWANLLNRLQKHELLEHESCINLLPKVSFENMNSIYSNYALSLSSTSARNTDILKNPVNVINLRAFEIPMAGGLQFCRYCKELADYFEDGKEIVFYRSQEEMVDKATYYTTKASNSEIMSMKMAARARAERDHTWTNRFEKAFDLLGIKKK